MNKAALYLYSNSDSNQLEPNAKCEKLRAYVI